MNLFCDALNVKEHSMNSQNKKEVTLGLVQMRCETEPKKNIDHAVANIQTAAKSGAQIICLQELFPSLYFCQSNDKKYFALAEEVPGPTSALLAKIAKDLQVVIVASLFEKAGTHYYNTACVLDADGTFLGKYRKVHIPDDPKNYYSEYFYFKPGDLGFKPFVTRFAKIGVQVCWDQWYPEGARSLALQGAEILFYPTAIGWHPKEKREYGTNQHGAWELIQRSHAVANGCYVAAVNRIGLEQPIGVDGLEFWGLSFVAGTSGQILAKASVDKEEVMVVPIDLSKVDVTRTHWPFLRDRRIDAYGGLTQRLID